MKREDVPDDLVKPAAEELWRLYDQEHDASHLSWQDFTGEARAVLALVLPAHEAMVRAKVAEEIYEADWANIPIWESDEELAEGHFTDRDLTSWLNTLGHAKAHPGCCKSCGCCTTCLASAFFDAVTATAARIARGGQA